jgi:methylmalonyl-CoA mutase N-terminal domain/subunit
MDAGDAVVVGVNRYVTDSGSAPIEILRIDPALEERQVAALTELRASRDRARCHAALDLVRSTARGGGNLMPPVVTAVEARATVGEISDALRDVFGEYRG